MKTHVCYYTLSYHSSMYAYGIHTLPQLAVSSVMKGQVVSIPSHSVHCQLQLLGLHFAVVVR